MNKKKNEFDWEKLKSGDNLILFTRNDRNGNERTIALIVIDLNTASAGGNVVSISDYKLDTKKIVRNGRTIATRRNYKEPMLVKVHREKTAYNIKRENQRKGIK